MDTSHNEPGVVLPGKRGWRRHSTEFKSRVIALAREPNTSVAAVALANGLNANMLRRWVREAESAAVDRSATPAAPVMPAFVPLTVPPVSGSPPRVPSAPAHRDFKRPVGACGKPADAWAADGYRPGRLVTGICTVVSS